MSESEREGGGERERAVLHMLGAWLLLGFTQPPRTRERLTICDVCEQRSVTFKHIRQHTHSYQRKKKVIYIYIKLGTHQRLHKEFNPIKGNVYSNQSQKIIRKKKGMQMTNQSFCFGTRSHVTRASKGNSSPTCTKTYSDIPNVARPRE